MGCFGLLGTYLVRDYFKNTEIWPVDAFGRLVHMSKAHNIVTKKRRHPIAAVTSCGPRITMKVNRQNENTYAICITSRKCVHEGMVSPRAHTPG